MPVGSTGATRPTDRASACEAKAAVGANPSDAAVAESGVRWAARHDTRQPSSTPSLT